MLIADALPNEVKAGLEGLGMTVTCQPDLGAHALPEAVEDVDILVVGRTRVTKRTIEAAKRLSFIVRAGAGVDTIDVSTASGRGILVADCAGADANARSELACGMVLALDRQLRAAFGSESAPALGLAGRSLGLVGYDAAAAAMQAVASAAGVRVHVWAPSLTSTLASEAGLHHCSSVDQLFAKCDIVSIQSGHGLDGIIATAERIASMPKHAMLVNLTDRGRIDLTAAKQRLEEGTLGLALDVYDADDYGDDVPFAVDAYPNVIATNHIASVTQQATDAIASDVVAAIEHFVTRQGIDRCVNLANGETDANVLVVRYKREDGALAAVLTTLAESGVSITDVSTRLFTDSGSGYARVSLTAPPDSSIIGKITRDPKVIAASLHGQ